MSKWTKTQNRVKVLLSHELTFVCCINLFHLLLFPTGEMSLLLRLVPACVSPLAHSGSCLSVGILHNDPDQ